MQFTKLAAHRETFEFCESGEAPNAQATDGLITGVAKKVDPDEIVTVELLMIRALLLTDVDRAANRGHAHQILECASDRDADHAAGTAFHIGVVGGSVVARRGSALEHVEVRKEFPAIVRT